jgi:hypothetical protein
MVIIVVLGYVRRTQNKKDDLSGRLRNYIK